MGHRLAAGLFERVEFPNFPLVYTLYLEMTNKHSLIGLIHFFCSTETYGTVLNQLLHGLGRDRSVGI